MLRPRLHRALLLTTLAVVPAGCGDIAGLFGSGRAAPPPSATARCAAMLEAGPRAQPTAQAGQEIAAPDLFAACMRSAGWQPIAPAPTATVLQLATPQHAPQPGVHRVPRRALGIEVSPIRMPFATAGYARDSQGLVVTEVIPGGAAQAAGLRRGDILLGFAGTPVGGPDTMQSTLARLAPGSRVAVELWRDQAPMLATLSF